jgi:hypothetical protein
MVMNDLTDGSRLWRIQVHDGAGKTKHDCHESESRRGSPKHCMHPLLLWSATQVAIQSCGQGGIKDDLRKQRGGGPDERTGHPYSATQRSDGDQYDDTFPEINVRRCIENLAVIARTSCPNRFVA